MKALSLWQPYASLAAARAKRVETRDWNTEHRGPLAIHATASVPEPYRSAYETMVHREPFDRWRRALGYSSLAAFPHGAIVGLVHVTSVVRLGPLVTETIRRSNGSDEIAFGNYDEGRYGWALDDDAILLPRPVPCRGERRIWTLPLDAERAIAEQLRHYPSLARAHPRWESDLRLYERAATTPSTQDHGPPQD
ncbi:MAG TPA: ASCH domain-containing protein [Gemmatimonadaceae bacterium]|nr:ASCH domain-containing protein [Gemmatimonadaceae bacterium]